LFEELFRYSRAVSILKTSTISSLIGLLLKDYANAENLFKGFVEVFPNSTKAEEMIICGLIPFTNNRLRWNWIRPTRPRPSVLCRHLSIHIRLAKNKGSYHDHHQCRAKLEEKDFKSAELYFDLGYFKAAECIEQLMNTYPDSEKSDEYKMLIIKSYYSFALQSVEEKKEDRFGQVVTQCNEFIDRFRE